MKSSRRTTVLTVQLESRSAPGDEKCGRAISCRAVAVLLGSRICARGSTRTLALRSTSSEARAHGCLVIKPCPPVSQHLRILEQRISHENSFEGGPILRVHAIVRAVAVTPQRWRRRPAVPRRGHDGVTPATRCVGLSGEAPRVVKRRERRELRRRTRRSGQGGSGGGVRRNGGGNTTRRRSPSASPTTPRVLVGQAVISTDEWTTRRQHWRRWGYTWLVRASRNSSVRFSRSVLRLISPGDASERSAGPHRVGDMTGD